jgi:hypothetical protein
MMWHIQEEDGALPERLEISWNIKELGDLLLELKVVFEHIKPESYPDTYDLFKTGAEHFRLMMIK